MLTGQGFKQVKPSYVSKPDLSLTEIHHQALHQMGVPEENKKLYGLPSQPRDHDPSMAAIFSWGENDPPVKNDFTANNGAFTLKHKINKLGVQFVSEKQDNYRDHTANMS